MRSTLLCISTVFSRSGLRQLLLVALHILWKRQFPVTVARLHLIIQYFRMTQSLKSEAAKSEDMFVQLQETQESVRLAFLNCFLDFAGMMEDLKFVFVNFFLKHA